MKSTVFGVEGFAGSAIAAELLSRGHDVRGLTRTLSDRPSPVADSIVGSIVDASIRHEATTVADWIIVAVDAVAGDGSALADAVPALARISRDNHARLGFVGGTGALLTASRDSLVMDEPWFPQGP